MRLDRAINWSALSDNDVYDLNEAIQAERRRRGMVFDPRTVEVNDPEPGYLITHERDPLRWLSEMLDMQNLPMSIHKQINDQFHALGKTWPPPRDRLEALSAILQEVRDDWPAERGRPDEMLDDIEEAHRFVLNALPGADQHERR